jgi:hypothetical protein
MSHLEKIIRFINQTCIIYNIDDSHDLRHSLEVLGWSEQLTKNSSRNITPKESQIIHLSCLLHDMCDKKYMDENMGLERIKNFLMGELEVEDDILEAVVFIISTMSYSKVIKIGYPDFNNKYDNIDLEYCYHVVRNSDLLCSYNPERCINYQIRCGGSRKEGIKKMLELFDNRILMLIENNYINLEEAKPYAIELHNKALTELEKYKFEYSILE